MADSRGKYQRAASSARWGRPSVAAGTGPEASRPRPPQASHGAGLVPVPWTGLLRQQLAQLSQATGADFAEIVTTGFFALVGRYAGRADLVLSWCAPGHGDSPEQVRALRVRAADDATFIEFLTRVSAELAAVSARPVGSDDRPSAADRGHPKVELRIGIEPARAGAAVPQQSSAGPGSYDVCLEIGAPRSERPAALRYRAELFDRTTLVRMAEQFSGLLSAAAAAPRCQVAQLPVITDSELETVTVRLARGPDLARDPATIADLFDQQVLRTPDAIAVECGTERLTYALLAARAEQIAARVGAIGAAPGALCALLLGRSLDRVTALMGVIQAGGAYLPLDPEHPRQRLATILRDARPSVILAQEGLLSLLPQTDLPTVVIDAGLGAAVAAPPGPTRRATPADLAYVMYTAGSTGGPKGVMVEHGCVTGFLSGIKDRMELGPGIRMLQLAGLAFDSSVCEIFGPLANGGTVVVPPPGADTTGPGLIEFLRVAKVTTALLPPSLLSALPSDPLPALHTLVVGGEVVSSGVFTRWGRRRFLVGYGPTETTLIACTGDRLLPDRPPPIGRPLPGVETYVLDPAMSLVAVGVVGEIWIGGSNVARGYLGSPGLTADRFRPHPGPDRPGRRLYRTGDLGRWLPSGDLEFLGRADGQVKICGHRVELGEVEQALLSLRGVRDCAVVPYGLGADLKLVAFTAGAELDVSRLADDLAAILPHPMLPSLIAPMEKLPIASNGGKVDRGRLRELAEGLLAGQDTPARPAGQPLVLHERFARRAAREPDRVALTDGARQLTYAQLDFSANRLAHRLLRCGAGPGALVGVCAERAADTVVALLAVLKAGSGYLPLDPAHPPARLRGMLADSGCALVVGRAKDRGLVESGGARLVLVDGDGIEDEPHTAPRSGVLGEHPAYVIYTSGSTGRPKGVVVTHANATRLFDVTEEEFRPGQRDVWTLFHSFAFDFSVWELWGALLYGGRLVLVPYPTSRDPEAFLRLVIEERVTVLNQTPSAFRHLIQAAAQAGFPQTSLRLVVFGGERLDPAMLRPWIGHYQDAVPRLVNMYGITETTVHVTLRDITAADLDSPASPVGRPLADLCVYLLDDQLRPVPAGETGEMYVAGRGVSAGYLGRPRLTAERFLPDPSGAGQRRYRTGDLAVLRPDGDLVFCGRADDQVQLRGFRIELGEVEAAILAQPAVREAAVVMRADWSGEQRLIGYVATTTGEADAGGLRAALAGLLPDYMIPAAFVAVPRLPVTVNGKLDRAALPDPSEQRRDGPGARPAPGTPAERELVRIWARAFPGAEVGAADNFFALGGDSMIALQVVAQAREAGLAFGIMDLYQHPTVAGLAGQLADGPQEQAAAVGHEPAAAAAGEPVPVLAGEPAAALSRPELAAQIQESYPACAMQMGIIYACEIVGDPTLYHDLTSVRVAGPVDTDALIRALEEVSVRHEVLRTSFDLEAYPTPLQLLHPEAPIPLSIGPAQDRSEHSDYGDQGSALRAWWREEWKRPFDLASAPLARCHILQHSDGTYDIAVSVHHAIVDGWSFSTIVTDLLLAYDRELGGGGQAGLVPAPRFRDSVELERLALRSSATRAFWGEWLAAHPPQTMTGALSMADPRRDPGAVTDGDVDPEIRTAVPPELLRGAREIADALGVPPKSVFLAAHMWTLSRLGCRPDVVTGTGANGRPERAGADRIAGLFLNCVPVHARVGVGTWRDLIREIFEAERALLPHRRYPFAQMCIDAGGPVFHALFNYVDFHVFESLGAMNVLKPLGWWFSDRSEFTLDVELARRPLSAEFEVSVRVDRRYLDPAVAATTADLFLQALAAVVADPLADCPGPGTAPGGRCGAADQMRGPR